MQEVNKELRNHERKYGRFTLERRGKKPIWGQLRIKSKRGSRTVNIPSAQLQQSLVERTRQAAQCTNKLVQENPWSAIGIAVGVGAILGYLIRRK